MVNKTQIEYHSEFLTNVTVVVVFNDDPLYSQVKVFFEQYGFGFMVPGQNLMIIDGEILVGEPDAKDILKFIEAHEVTHILLGHDGPRNDQDEIEADLGAYILLQDKGYNKSIELLVNNFMERHGIDFDESMVEKIRHKVSVLLFEQGDNSLLSIPKPEVKPVQTNTGDEDATNIINN